MHKDSSAIYNIVYILIERLKDLTQIKDYKLLAEANTNKYL